MGPDCQSEKCGVPAVSGPSERGKGARLRCWAAPNWAGAGKAGSRGGEETGLGREGKYRVLPFFFFFFPFPFYFLKLSFEENFNAIKFKPKVNKTKLNILQHECTTSC